MKNSQTSEAIYASYHMAQWWFFCALFFPMIGLGVIDHNLNEVNQVETSHVVLSVLFYLLLMAYQIIHFNRYPAVISAKKISRAFVWWVRVIPVAAHIVIASGLGLIPVEILSKFWSFMAIFISGYLSIWIIWIKCLEGKVRLR